MTIKELKAKIENLPDNMDVFVNQIDTEFNHALAETAEVRTIKFVDGKLKATDDCLVITDEIV